MKRIIVFNSLLILYIYVGWCTADIKYAPVVMTKSGPVRGIVKETLVEKRNYSAYLSVPYGKARRFMQPGKPDAWTNVLDATENGNICPQYDPFTKDIIGSEDCLRLNVYTPKVINQSSALLPVMVWISGGGYIIGFSNYTIYGPDFLIEDDVVVVSLNYRVNVLGFLAVNHPDASGNAGLEDQRLAFMWVQENIANFGGDPTRVTIFGESAGAASVDFHVLSDRSKGLFHRTISQSGGPFCSWSMIKPHKVYQNSFKLGAYLGFKGTTAEELLAFLYTIDAKTLVKSAWENLQLLFLPTIQPPHVITKEKAFLSECPYKKLKTGDYNKVPRIMGYIKDEGITIAGLVANGIPNLESQAVYSAGHTIIEVIRSITENMTDKSLLAISKVITDSTFVAPIDLQRKFMSVNNEHEIFYYRYSLDSTHAFHRYLFNVSGAAHFDEIPMIFRTDLINTPTDTNVVEGRIRKTIVRLWTNFAKYGHPTPAPNRDPWANFLWKDSRTDGTMIDIGETIQLTKRLPEQEVTVAIAEEVIKAHIVNYIDCTSLDN